MAEVISTLSGPSLQNFDLETNGPGHRSQVGEGKLKAQISTRVRRCWITRFPVLPSLFRLFFYAMQLPNLQTLEIQQD